MRDIYVRHRPRCRYGKADFEDPKGRLPRNIFGCGCPIYARLEIRDPVTKDVLFRHNGSLKGITAKEAAEELVNGWFVKYLTGEKPPSHEQKEWITIEEAINRYIAEKQSALPPPKMAVVSDAVIAFQKTKRGGKEVISDSIRKISDILTPLVAFMAEKGITYLKDVKTEHLTEFRHTWKGRVRTNPSTGEKEQLPKSAHGKSKYQEYVRAFFRRCRLLGWINSNPAELLEPIRTEAPEIKVYRADEKRRILEAIPKTFPKKAGIVRAFVLVQKYSALRLSDTVSLEVVSLQDDGIMVRAQRKTDEPVYSPLPPAVIGELRQLKPTSAKYFFWTGNGQLETATKRWSATMLKLFRAAGIPEGKRSHNWRDTLATEILEDDEGRLEDAQIALGHKSRKTTEKYYTAITKRRTERVTELKKKLWALDEVVG
jgi:integrase